jgi:hypothetical protein
MHALAYTVPSMTTFGWMKQFFALVGDMIPNSFGEIHLEPTDIIDIYMEYCRDLDNCTTPLEKVSYSTFCQLWTLCFEHVKIRQYKAVSGKCNTCAFLSEMRRSFADPRRRQLITLFHALHRTTYMQERLAYYDRKFNAINFPDSYLSCIIDGMAQNHSMLPWCGNLKEFNPHIKQYIIGALLHGRNLTAYRYLYIVAAMWLYKVLHPLYSYVHGMSLIVHCYFNNLCIYMYVSLVCGACVCFNLDTLEHFIT